MKNFLGFLTYNNVFSSGQILSDRNQIQILYLCVYICQERYVLLVFSICFACSLCLIVLIWLLKKLISLSPRGRNLGIGLWHRIMKSLTLCLLYCTWATCQHFYFIVWYKKMLKYRWIPEHAHTIDISQQIWSITQYIVLLRTWWNKSIVED